MRNYIHLFLIICCLACDGSTPVEPPSEKITPEMMEDIFYDLMLMKAIKNSSYVDPAYEEYFTDSNIICLEDTSFSVDTINLTSKLQTDARKIYGVFENSRG